MPLATLKEKGQITLPSEIRKRIHASKGDMFDVEVIDGKVIMTPQRLVPTKDARGEKKKKPLDLSKYVGATSGTYGDTAEEVDAYVRNERDSWD